MIVRYIGPFPNSSGYASAARNNVVAMARAGIDLTITQVSFEDQYTSHGEVGKLIQSYTDRTGYWDANIIHLTPENWPRFIQPSKYNIGYTVWETSRLPASWVPIINSVNEVWVPSQFNVQVFRDSGVTIPIKCIPHAFDPELPNQPFNKETFTHLDNVYKFYSIFQWTERKNPHGLLRAYLTEFDADDDVTLFLKTYHMGWSEKQQSLIKTHVRELKQELGLSNYPPIQFIGNLLSHNDMQTIHQVGDCCVMPHRGEGFGLVPAEAMLHGKPTISTNWSGNLEYMNHQNSYLVDYKLVPVEGMPWADKYTSDQEWSEPSIASLREYMRRVFSDPAEGVAVGLRGQKTIRDNFSFEKIGNLIKETLGKI